MKRTWPVLLVLLLLAAPVAVQGQDLQNYDYVTNADGATITITGYSGPGGAVSIPASLIGLPVTGIGDNAFQDSSLTSVTIPATVTNIGDGAFSFSTGLTAITVDPQNTFYSSANGVLFDKSQTTLVEFPGGLGGSYTIPDGVTSIGDYAFEFCTNLTSLTVPGNLTNIGNDAFTSCLYLTNATIGIGVTSIGDFAFSGCLRLAIYFSGNAPAFGVEPFWDGSFYYPVTLYYLLGAAGWPSSQVDARQVVQPLYEYTTNAGTITITGLSEAGSFVIIPSSINGLPVTEIGDGALFENSLSYVLIPGTVTSIGDLAFYGATNLTSLTIPSSVTNIGQFAFYDCTSLGSITITAETTFGYGPGQIAPYYGSPTITSNSTSIADAAFYGCTSLSNLTLTEGVTSLGNLSFYGCTSLAWISTDRNSPNIGGKKG